MTWKSKKGSDFNDQYKTNTNLHELFDFAITLVLESNDPKTLSLTIECPSSTDKCMINLQNTHAIIYKIHSSSNEIEFIFCG